MKGKLYAILMAICLTLVLAVPVNAGHVRSDGRGGYWNPDGSHIRSDGRGGYWMPDGKHVQSDGRGGFRTPN